MANFYFDAYDKKQGPYIIQQLQVLADRGIITSSTQMETDTGQKGFAGQIPGLKFNTPKQTPTVDLFCTNCGNSLSEQVHVCMSCGARPTGHKKFCRQCGVALNPEQVVCIKCGSEIHATELFQFSGRGMSSLSGFFSANGISFGEVTILAATLLAIISFFLPWIEVMIPSMEKISKNGFSTFTFSLGLIFFYSVWMSLEKKRTTFQEIEVMASSLAKTTKNESKLFAYLMWLTFIYPAWVVLNAFFGKKKELTWYEITGYLGLFLGIGFLVYGVSRTASQLASKPDIQRAVRSSGGYTVRDNLFIHHDVAARIVGPDGVKRATGKIFVNTVDVDELTKEAEQKIGRDELNRLLRKAEQEAVREAERDAVLKFTVVGTGWYMFMCACVILQFGIGLMCRPIKDILLGLSAE